MGQGRTFIDVKSSGSMGRRAMHDMDKPGTALNLKSPRQRLQVTDHAPNLRFLKANGMLPLSI